MANSSINLNSLANTLGISSLTADTTPDISADYVATYDASASNNKKVALINLPYSMTLLSTATASSSATIDFTGLSSTYYTYILVYDGVALATDAQALTMRVSTDGGSNYLSTNYNYWCHGVDDTTTRTEAVASSSGTYISLSGATTEMGNAASEEASGMIRISNPSHSLVTRIFYENMNGDTATRICGRRGFGYNTTTSPINAIRILATSGNIASGVFKLYGIKG